MSMIGSAYRRAALLNPAGIPVLGAAGVLALLVVLGTSGPSAATPTRPDEQPERTTISGVVVDEAGNRHLGVIVKLHEAGTGDEPGPEIRPAYTGVDGRYRFEGLEPGCYQVEVDAPAGTTFADGAPATTHLTCTTAGETTAELRAVTRPEADDPEGDPSANAKAGSGSVSGSGSTRSIDIVHIGHHLGHLEPSTLRLDLAGTEVNVEVGGWPRVVTAIEEARPIDAPESTITVNTGGVLAGSTLAHLFGGAADAAILNRACFDYLAPSPEDRARADEWEIFRHFLDGTPCPTTVLDADGPARPAAAIPDPAVAIHAVGSTAVGLVAVAVDPASGGDPVAATTARVEELIDEDTTIIVVVSGLGLEANRALARRLPAVDAIVGSGPGSLLGDVADLGLDTGGPYPDRTLNADGDPVCLGHTGLNATALGQLRIEVDREGRVSDCGGQIQLLTGRQVVVAADDSESDDESENDEPPSAAEIERAVSNHPALAEVTPDLETSRALDRWSNVRDLLLDDPVARVTTDLCRTEVPGRSVGLLCGSDDRVVDTTAPRADAQRLVADAFRHRSAQLDLPAIALIDSQTVGETITPGPLSTVAAYRLLAPRTTLSVVRLTGAELTAVLQERIEAALDGTPGAYPHTSGLRLTPDLTRPNRPRLGPIEVLDRSDRWQPLDPLAAYRVVVPDRLLSDEEGSPTLAALGSERVTRTTVGAAEALLDYIDDVLGGVVEPPGTPPGEVDPEADPIVVEPVQEVDDDRSSRPVSTTTTSTTRSGSGSDQTDPDGAGVANGEGDEDASNPDTTEPAPDPDVTDDAADPLADPIDGDDDTSQPTDEPGDGGADPDDPGPSDPTG